MNNSQKRESINILDDSTDDFKENFKLLKNTSDHQSKLKLSNINKYLVPFNECSKTQQQQQQQKETKEQKGTKKRKQNSKKEISKYFTTSQSQQNKEEKVNEDLINKVNENEGDIFKCPICSIELKNNNETLRQVHVNECLDKFSKPKKLQEQQQKSIGSACKSPKPIDNSLKAKIDEKFIEKMRKEGIPNCPICGKIFHTINSRQSHIKKCAQTFHIRTESLVDLLKRQTDRIENELKKGIIPNDLYIPKETNKSQRAKQPTRIMKLEEPKNEQDEQLQMAIALSNSLQKKEDIQPKMNKANKKLIALNAVKENSAILLTTDEDKLKIIEKRLSDILSRCIQVKNTELHVKHTSKFTRNGNYLWDKCKYFTETNETFYVKIFINNGKVTLDGQLFADKMTNNDKFNNITIINTQTAFLLAELNNQTQIEVSFNQTQQEQNTDLYQNESTQLSETQALKILNESEIDEEYLKEKKEIQQDDIMLSNSMELNEESEPQLQEDNSVKFNIIEHEGMKISETQAIKFLNKTNIENQCYPRSENQEENLSMEIEDNIESFKEQTFNNSDSKTLFSLKNSENSNESTIQQNKNDEQLNEVQLLSNEINKTEKNNGTIFGQKNDIDLKESNSSQNDSQLNELSIIDDTICVMDNKQQLLPTTDSSNDDSLEKQSKTILESKLDMNTIKESELITIESTDSCSSSEPQEIFANDISLQRQTQLKRKSNEENEETINNKIIKLDEDFLTSSSSNDVKIIEQDDNIWHNYDENQFNEYEYYNNQTINYIDDINNIDNINLKQNELEKEEHRDNNELSTRGDIDIGTDSNEDSLPKIDNNTNYNSSFNQDVYDELIRLEKESCVKFKQTPQIRRIEVDNNKATETPCTPLPDYPNMETPNLKNELKKFGLKALPRKQAIKKLVEIYEYTHPKYNGSLTRSKSFSSIPTAIEQNTIKITTDDSSKSIFKQKQSNKKTLKKTKSCIEQLTNDKIETNDDLFNQFENSVYMESLASSQTNTQTLGGNNKLNENEMKIKVKQFITQHKEIHLKALTYEPIEYDVLLEQFKKYLNNIKVNSQLLMKILDEYCVTFTLKNFKSRVKRKASTNNK